jgi:cell division protein FtsI/penicillin-binding protein 2
MRRISAVLVALGVLVGGLSACSGGGSSSDDAAAAVVRKLAAALTAAAAPASDAKSDPLAALSYDGVPGATVAKEYAAIVAKMDGIAPTVKVAQVAAGAKHPSATLSWSWPVSDGAEPWSYRTTVGLVHGSGDAWSVIWAPDVVQPDLTEGDVLDAVTQPSDRGDITGARGQVLVTERSVMRFGIDRGKVPAAQAPASARALAQLVGIDVPAYVQAVRTAGPRAFVEAITYRADQIPPGVEARASSIAGFSQLSAQLALAPTRDFAAPILGRVGPVTAEMVKKSPDVYRNGDIAGVSGLQARYDDQLRGTPGRVVYLVPKSDTAQRTVLFHHDAVAGKPLAITLDQRLQTLAEQVLARTGPASALVAIRPSDGAILAAANGSGTGGQNYATFGQFAPGSTFKMVTSLALLRAGLTPDSPVPCTPTVNVNGKQFKNYSDYPPSAIGTIPLRRALAQSCNTAFISQRAKLTDGDLSAAAATLGLGVDHDLGFPSYFGAVPPAASDTEGAADMIGQGKILASPMAMATVIASIQAGKTVVPRLVDQVDVSVPASAKPLTAAEARELRTMLRGVVTEGSGRGLLGIPGAPVIAKTGTAEYDDKGTVRTHAWMVAAHGDLAVAVFVNTGESGSRTAGPLLEAFLRGAH